MENISITIFSFLEAIWAFFLQYFLIVSYFWMKSPGCLYHLYSLDILQSYTLGCSDWVTNDHKNTRDHYDK